MGPIDEPHLPPPSAEFYAFLVRRKIPYVFLSNTGAKGSQGTQTKLAKMGFMMQHRPVPLRNIYTAAQAQVAYLVSHSHDISPISPLYLPYISPISRLPGEPRATAPDHNPSPHPKVQPRAQPRTRTRAWAWAWAWPRTELVLAVVRSASAQCEASHRARVAGVALLP